MSESPFLSRFFERAQTATKWPVIAEILKEEEEGIFSFFTNFEVGKVSVEKDSSPSNPKRFLSQRFEEVNNLCQCSNVEQT